MKDFVQFPSGAKMPKVGYGMWQSNNPQELEDALETAFAAGYWHFDTAFGYKNEHVLGKVLKKWLASGKVKREELFIVTKLPPYGNHPGRVARFLQASLDFLQLDYVDLYLIHNPATLQVEGPDGMVPKRDGNGNAIPDLTCTLEETWKALEAMVKAGKTKAIGLSSFSTSQVERIVKCASIKPANHQIELNAYYPRKAMREVCKKHGISICAFAPLGSPGRKEYAGYGGTNSQVSIPPLLEDPIVNEIAKRMGKSPAQVLLRYLYQLDIVVIPKSVTPSRIKSNFDLASFELNAFDMKRLDTLDSGKEGGSWAFDWKNGLPGIENHPEFQLD